MPTFVDGGKNAPRLASYINITPAAAGPIDFAQTPRRRFADTGADVRSS